MSSDALEADSLGTDERNDESAAESHEDLLAQVELLAEENRRLREEYVRSRQNSYRRTALGLFAVGALATLGALALPDSRTVLFALGGTGLFAGVLTYFLTPEQFIAARTGEQVYRALAETGAELVAELGLQDVRIYAPARPTGEEFSAVRLYVPNRVDYSVPGPEELDSLFVVGERERGVALPPTGGALYREFESSMVEAIAESPAGLAEQLAEALVEGFEIAERTRVDVDSDAGRATVEISGSAYGPVDRFDHPITSFLAVGMATNLDVPVQTEVTANEEGDADFFVTCRWDPEDVGSADEKSGRVEA